MISNTHNNNRILLLHLVISSITARSESQMFSSNGKYLLRFLNFLIIGLCNSFAGCWFSGAASETFQNILKYISISFSKIFLTIKASIEASIKASIKASKCYTSKIKQQCFICNSDVFSKSFSSSLYLVSHLLKSQSIQ